MNRYHIQREDTRTTVTLDSTICELLALKLGISPDAKESHKEVRQWLQTASNTRKSPQAANLSQWLKRKAVLHIADDTLIAKHHQWQEDVDQIWEEELTKRINEIDSGEVEMRSRNEVFKRARAQIS